jgi:hypothetical protein
MFSAGCTERISRPAPYISHLGLLYSAISQYKLDHHRYPPMSDMAGLKKALYPKYVNNGNVFWDSRTTSFYRTNPLLSNKVAGTTNLINAVVLCEDRPNKDGRRLVLFDDGSVRNLSDKEWSDARITTGL